MVCKNLNRSILKKIFWIKIFKFLKIRDMIIFSKNNHIPKIFQTFKLKIHKGHIFRILPIDKFTVGFKFGMFTFSRKPHTFVKKKKKLSGKKRR